MHLTTTQPQQNPSRRRRVNEIVRSRRHRVNVLAPRNRRRRRTGTRLSPRSTVIVSY